eukprot:sb/3475783/
MEIEITALSAFSPLYTITHSATISPLFPLSNSFSSSDTENNMNKLTPTKDNKDGMEDNIPASLLGHKKLLIKRSIPAPPMYQNSTGGCAATTQLKFSTEVKVKVDKHASGIIAIDCSLTRGSK